MYKRLDQLILAILFFILLLPLFFTSSTLFPWHFGKTIIFCISVDVAAILGIIYLRKTKNIEINFSLLDFLLLLFVLILGVATFFGFDPVRSFWGDQSRAQGVIVYFHLYLYYLLIRQFLHERHVIGLYCKTIVWVAVLSSLIAWLGPYLPFFSGKIAIGDRISGLLGNPIFFAGYLLAPLFLSGWLITNVKIGNSKKFIFTGIFLFLLISIFGSQSRGVLLGVVVGFFVVALDYLIRFTEGKQRKKLLMLATIGLIALGGIFILSKTTEFITGISPSLQRVFDISLSTETGKTRIMAWDIAVQGWKERPFLGWGPESFQMIFDRYYDPRFLAYSFKETVWDKPHNFLLELLVSSGLIGLLSFLSLFIVAVYSVITPNNSPHKNAENIFLDDKKNSWLLGFLIAYIVQSFFGIETTLSLLHLFFVFALISIVWGRNMTFSLTIKKYYTKIPKHLMQGIVSGVFVLAIFLLGITIYKQLHLYQSSKAIALARDSVELDADMTKWINRAEQALYVQSPYIWENAIYVVQDMARLQDLDVLQEDMVKRIFPLLEDIFLHKIGKNEDVYQYHFWLGQTYQFYSEYVDPTFFERSNEEFEKAGEISPRQQRIPLLLAKNYLLQGNQDRALATLDELVYKNNEYAEVHWFYGLALLQSGKKEKALQELDIGKSYGLFSKQNILFLIDVYAKEQRFTDVVTLYKMLIELEPNNAIWYTRLAATYAALGSTEEVIESINKALILDPSLSNDAIEFLKSQGINQ